MIDFRWSRAQPTKILGLSILAQLDTLDLVKKRVLKI